MFEGTFFFHKLFNDKDSSTEIGELVNERSINLRNANFTKKIAPWRHQTYTSLLAEEETSHGDRCDRKLRSKIQWKLNIFL